MFYEATGTSACRPCRHHPRRNQVAPIDDGSTLAARPPAGNPGPSGGGATLACAGGPEAPRRPRTAPIVRVRDPARRGGWWPARPWTPPVRGKRHVVPGRSLHPVAGAPLDRPLRPAHAIRRPEAGTQSNARSAQVRSERGPPGAGQRQRLPSCRSTKRLRSIEKSITTTSVSGCRRGRGTKRGRWGGGVPRSCRVSGCRRGEALNADRLRPDR